MRIPQPRRPRPSYANVASTLALALALSMGGAYAHGKIGPNDIRPKAVKAKHIAPQAVTKSRLAPNARGAREVVYTSGPHDFGTSPHAILELPVKAGQARKSDWDIHLVYPNGDVVELDWDSNDNVGAFVRTRDATVTANIYDLTSVGVISEIRAFQTLPVKTKKAGAKYQRSAARPGTGR